MTVERDDDRGFHVRGTYDDGKQGWVHHRVVNGISMGT